MIYYIKQKSSPFTVEVIFKFSLDAHNLLFRWLAATDLITRHSSPISFFINNSGKLICLTSIRTLSKYLKSVPFTHRINSPITVGPTSDERDDGEKNGNNPNKAQSN